MNTSEGKEHGFSEEDAFARKVFAEIAPRGKIRKGGSKA